MLSGKRFIGLIPARAGSKRIKNKNIRNFVGKPLVAWTIEAAKGSEYLDEIHVSTDSSEIQKLALFHQVRCDHLRSAEYSTDKASSVDVVLEFLKTHENFDYIVLLQPTSPLRTSHHIDGAIELLLQTGADSLVSLGPASDHPSHIFTVDREKAQMVPLVPSDLKTRTQDLPKYFSINGAIYIVRREVFLEKKQFINNGSIPYLMERVESLDIDTEFDFLVAETMWREHGK